MRPRKKSLGKRNMIGQSVTLLRESCAISQDELLRRLHAVGLTIDQSKLSKIEGQHAPASDIDVFYFTMALGVTYDQLFAKGPSRPLQED